MTTTTPARGKARTPITFPGVFEDPALKRDGRLLTNQAGLRRKNPPWKLVEETVRGLEPSSRNGYCVLNLPDDRFIQSMCGFNGMIVERGGAEHGVAGTVLRACYKELPGRPQRLAKFGPGVPAQIRDLMPVDDVVDCFRLFYLDPDDGGWLNWRVLKF